MGKGILFYVIILFGVLLIVYGLILWKKQKVNLLVGYNSRNIKKEDIKGYTRSMGISYIIMGISILPLGILSLTNNDNYVVIGTMVWLVGFIISQVININTQKKYNAGIFK